MGCPGCDCRRERKWGQGVEAETQDMEWRGRTWKNPESVLS